jgi:hypothetical protein
VPAPFLSGPTTHCTSGCFQQAAAPLPRRRRMMPPSSQRCRSRHVTRHSQDKKTPIGRCPSQVAVHHSSKWNGGPSGTTPRPANALRPCLVPQFSPKFHYAKRRFPVTSKCRQMHGVLNVDEIKN